MTIEIYGETIILNIYAITASVYVVHFVAFAQLELAKIFDACHERPDRRVWELFIAGSFLLFAVLLVCCLISLIIGAWS